MNSWTLCWILCLSYEKEATEDKSQFRDKMEKEEMLLMDFSVSVFVCVCVYMVDD